MNNNEILALVYNADVPQIVVIYPIVWRHNIGGNWYIKAILNDPN